MVGVALIGRAAGMFALLVCFWVLLLGPLRLMHVTWVLCYNYRVGVQLRLLVCEHVARLAGIWVVVC